MNSLLENSRRKANQNQDPIRLDNLSPEKYGKGAFCDLTYTPSKLADNFLFRDVTTLKKMEEGNGKLRQTQALKSLFQDRLVQLREERDGIEKSLSSQIIMYKKLLVESESKNEARIKDIQFGFKIQIKRLLDQKEQDAKYGQSQKQLLQNKIQQLEDILNELKDKYDEQGRQFDNVRNNKQKLDIMYRNSCQNIADLESKGNIDADNTKRRQQQLNKKLYSNQMSYKKQHEQTVAAKNKQIQNLQRFHRTELQKLQNKRSADNLMKNQQIKDITNAFESENKRLNQIINMKERAIESINKDLNKQKQRVLELTRSYQNEINNLTHQKTRLLDEVDDLNQENTTLNIKLNDIENQWDKEKLRFQGYVNSLKDDLDLNQVNYIREKDRNCFIAGDLEKQNSGLRVQLAALKSLEPENDVLSREVRNLRELLLESSHEMERCKEQFIRMGKQRDFLVVKLRELGYENDTLHRIKVEREEEARGWKESYFINKGGRY